MPVSLWKNLRNRFHGGEMVLMGLVAMAISHKFMFLNHVMMKGSLENPLTLLALMGTSVALAGLPLLLPRKLRGAGFVFVDFWLTVLVWTDLLSLRYYSDLFTLRNLGLGTQLSSVAVAVIALMEPRDALLWADFLFLVPLSFRLGRRSNGLPPLEWRRAGAVTAMLALFLVPFGMRIDRFRETCPGALASMWDRPAVALSISG